MTGKVKSYNPSTRYGFITSGGVDFRFHKNDWELRLPPAVGMEVEFLKILTGKGMRAVGVRGTNDDARN